MGSGRECVFYAVMVHAVVMISLYADSDFGQLEHVYSDSFKFQLHNRWQAVSAEDLEVVKKVATACAGTPSLSTVGSIWACSLCVDWNGRAQAIKAHLLSE